MDDKSRLFAILVSLLILSVTTVSVFHDHSSVGKTSALDIIIIAGQSNAEYASERCDVDQFRNLYQDAPTYNLYYYGTKSSPSNYYDYESNNNTIRGLHFQSMWRNGSWAIGGYEPLIANEISKMNNNDVLVLNIGVGGKNISELLPGSIFGDYGFRLMDSALHEASLKYHQINMLFWIWIQGEADYSTPVADYVMSFQSLQQTFSEYGLNKTFIVHTRTMWGGNSNTAQEYVASIDDRVKIVGWCTEYFSLYEGDCLLDEPGAYGIHYSCKGRVEIAKDIVSEYHSQNPINNY